MGVAVRLVLVAGLVLAGCTGAPGADEPLAGPVETELDALFSEVHFLSAGDLDVIAGSRDRRVAWPLVDLLRFHQQGDRAPDLVAALEQLTGQRVGDDWVAFTDLLLADDVPAPPSYLGWKRTIFLAVDDSWQPFFDADADLDWREVTWGGVFRDGIPALEDPPAVPAAAGGWLPDDDIVFGVVAGGESRAYPRRVLEVHEIVNDELGGARMSLPYCTLCGAPIAYATDLRMRTSGLLQRSNKLMYDEASESLFDQFRGVAVAGSRRGLELEMLPLTVTTWGAWREVHPETSILSADAGTGRVYEAEPLGDRDAAGPVFPVGERDERLPAQERVLGVTSPRGQPVAFPVERAREALRAGEEVRLAGVELRLDAGGLAARPADGGPDLPAHEAFWFAWSQFHPGTLLWP
jgi:hypothetical protein